MSTITTIKAAATRLGELSKLPVQSFATVGADNVQDNTARSVVANHDQAGELIDLIRPELGPGMIAFIGKPTTAGDLESDVEVVVAHGKDQFDIVRIARTDGAKYGLSTEDIIERLKVYHEQIGIEVFEASDDSLSFILEEIPENLTELCEDFEAFCPDLTAQMVNSIEELEEIIVETQMVVLWWDRSEEDDLEELAEEA
ncbi:DUF4253 domain-containing protein [Planctomicrobium sp. SH668]|uniref:DUF4253 domain-containing protein n=1 Tax=Planctomicrobium sp. SH668 TaxID=3448126 RepID=UPI003F5BFD92